MRCVASRSHRNAFHSRGSTESCVYVQLCKQRMLPRRQQRWLTFLYVLDCLQAPLYYGAFGCVRDAEPCLLRHGSMQSA